MDDTEIRTRHVQRAKRFEAGHYTKEDLTAAHNDVAKLLTALREMKAKIDRFSVAETLKTSQEPYPIETWRMTYPAGLDKK